MHKKQIVKLYLVAIFESFSLGNASWVALLALRGYSIAQIGILESIFHVVSLCGEIPSGVMADVLGPALFLMQMGAAFGAKLVQYCQKLRFGKIIVCSVVGIMAGLVSLIFGNPHFVIAGGFIAAFFDDFMEVRADIMLNEQIPSEQRATLVSVSSFCFSMIMILLSPFMGWIFDRI